MRNFVSSKGLSNLGKVWNDQHNDSITTFTTYHDKYHDIDTRLERLFCSQHTFWPSSLSSYPEPDLYQFPVAKMRITTAILATSFLASSTLAQNPAFAICQAGCAGVVLTCYGAAGVTYGLALLTASTAVVACNEAFGTCSGYCAALAWMFLPLWHLLRWGSLDEQQWHNMRLGDEYHSFLPWGDRR